jgi:threonylcarbamoyladenosine tRNA methylthiotransferase MtaB
MAEHSDRIVPHLHLCLQSGSDSVLRRMRRRWGTKMFLDRCRLLRERLQDPAITTDVIVGFPGETEQEFAQTLSTCRQAGFSKIHVFPFSPRRGTPAAEMPDQIAKSLRSERVGRLSELESELRREYFQRLVGRRLQLLVESSRCFAGFETFAESSRSHDLLLRGTTCRYAPAEWLAEANAAEPLEIGQLAHVTVDGTDGEKLFVKPAKTAVNTQAALG